jgi:internalin A
MKPQVHFLIIAFCINITAISQENTVDSDNCLHVMEDGLGFDYEIEIGIIDIDNINNIETIDRLYFSNSTIINFQNIKKAENLEYLYLSNCFFDSSVENIAGLIKLKHLDITFCKLVDINFLRSIKSLEYLCLDNNNISDITVLENLNNLFLLSLMNNNISDISSLKNLYELLYLNLRYNNISDFSPINNLVKLTNLRID